MTARKRARRVDTEQISAEERELRWLEGGDPVVQPAQPAWSMGAAPASRLAIALLMIFLVAMGLACGDVERAANTQNVRQADRMRTRLNFQNFVEGMTDKEFLRYYRIRRTRAEGDATPSVQSFDELVRAVTPPADVLARKQRTARNSTAGFTGYDLRVSIALRYLAGGSYLDIMYLHGVGRSAFYLHLWPTLAAIDAALPEFSLEADIYDLQRCRQLAAGFARKTDTLIRGATAAIIFKVVKERPAVVNNEEVVNPNKSSCRPPFRPSCSCSSRSRWRTSLCQRLVIVGAQAEGVGRGRVRPVLQWTGALGAAPRWGVRSAVGALLPCSMRDLLRPWNMCVSAPCGANLAQKGPFAGAVCSTRKMRNEYWQMSFKTS